VTLILLVMVIALVVLSLMTGSVSGMMVATSTTRIAISVPCSAATTARALAVVMLMAGRTLGRRRGCVGMVGCVVWVVRMSVSTVGHWRRCLVPSWSAAGAAAVAVRYLMSTGSEALLWWSLTFPMGYILLSRRLVDMRIGRRLRIWHMLLELSWRIGLRIRLVIARGRDGHCSMGVGVRWYSLDVLRRPVRVNRRMICLGWTI
jgi:hypothetical protein